MQLVGALDFRPAKIFPDIHLLWPGKSQVVHEPPEQLRV
jgi:hypothetical protein